MQTHIRFNSSQKINVLNKTRGYKYYGSFTPEIYYTIAIANATATLFYGEGGGNRNHNRKNGCAARS